MAMHSAGLLLYRRRGRTIQVFLVHPGGPYWAKRDAGAWSIPKGEFDPEEDALAAAKREFTEETGLRVDGTFRALTPAKQPSGKIVRAFAVEADADPDAIESNSFEMEWPPHSGDIRAFPEVDRAGWFGVAAARTKLVRGQVQILDEFRRKFARPPARRPRRRTRTG